MIFENMDKIVFAGDSVTDMGCAKPAGEGLGDALGHGYVRMVENLLASTYPERRLRIINMGISGNTSRDLLSRWDKDVASKKPDWVSICIGINDVWRQFDMPSNPESWVLPDEYEKNVEKMLVSAKAMCKGVFLMTPYYMEPNANDEMRARMDEYGAICKKLAEKHGVTFIDLQEMFNNYFTHRHSTYIAWDRVHPNEVGAMVIARKFLSYCDFNFNHQA